MLLQEKESYAKNTGDKNFHNKLFWGEKKALFIFIVKTELALFIYTYI